MNEILLLACCRCARLSVCTSEQKTAIAYAYRVLFVCVSGIFLYLALVAKVFSGAFTSHRVVVYNPLECVFGIVS